MIHSFTAIDLETAHNKRWSICQIGLVKVEHGKISEEVNLLIQPPYNEYKPVNIGIHGITPEHTKNEPTFDQAWHKIKPYIEGQPVVAHNGPSFDFSALKQTLLHKFNVLFLQYTCIFCVFNKRSYNIGENPYFFH
ncbi:MAG: exonuclease domain-containing protein [Bacteroidota bacterium]